MIFEAAKGFRYLESRGILHRDIACRNLLCSVIDDQYVVKITDFGLSKDASIYKMNDESTIPVRWTAPEILNRQIYTTKSDVWSFGVVIWEIFSFADVPYGLLTNKEVTEQVTQRKISLGKPNDCPDQVYNLLIQCMNFNVHLRPNFAEIAEAISLFHSNKSQKNLVDKRKSQIVVFGNSASGTYVLSPNVN